jgi:hypothetical protein
VNPSKAQNPSLNPSRGRDGLLGTLGMLNPSHARDGLGRVELGDLENADGHGKRNPSPPRDGSGRVERPAMPSNPSPVPLLRRDGSGWMGEDDFYSAAGVARTLETAA